MPIWYITTMEIYCQDVFPKTFHILFRNARWLTPVFRLGFHIFVQKND